MDTQSAEYRNILEKNAKFAQRLNEVLPLDDGQPKDMSLIMGTPLSHVESKVFVGNEDFDGALLQVEKLKSYISKLELQIYEMNEKVSELIENVSELSCIPPTANCIILFVYFSPNNKSGKTKALKWRAKI